MSKLITEKTLYSLSDISTIPARITDIKSRSECNETTWNLERKNNTVLPVIVSPMSCNFIEEDDIKIYLENNLNVVVPRTIDLDKRRETCQWVMTAFSLKESKQFLTVDPCTIHGLYICIDMANGHMKEQIETGKALKERFGDKLKLMGGNIANPEAYYDYSEAKFDYVRSGIGGGSGCLTSTQTSTHYPMASLLNELSKIQGIVKVSGGYETKIVADGGISGYSDAIKCLALGADYVMMGKVFTKAALHGEPIGTETAYYGMSTKKAQKEMGGIGNKTSEGKETTVKKEYTLEGWVENFRDYLKSAMSYSDSRTIPEFKLKAVCQVISPNSSYMINNK